VTAGLGPPVQALDAARRHRRARDRLHLGPRDEVPDYGPSEGTPWSLLGSSRVDR